MELFENVPEQPMELFASWLELAGKQEPNDPNAAALATSTADGIPSVRMVLVKGADERGVRFFTNLHSEKGEELLANPHAAMCLHWKSLRRQVRFAGNVQQLSREETAEYFHSRSRGSQIAAAMSQQSRKLESRDVLDAAVRAYTAKLGEAEVPLPEEWGGFLLMPRRIEFWSDGKDRLHDRICFTRQGDGWAHERLYP